MSFPGTKEEPLIDIIKVVSIKRLTLEWQNLKNPLIRVKILRSKPLLKIKNEENIEETDDR